MSDQITTDYKLTLFARRLLRGRQIPADSRPIELTNQPNLLPFLATPGSGRCV